MCNSIDGDIKHAELMLENRRLKQALVTADEALVGHKKHDNEIEHQKEHRELSNSIAFLTAKLAIVEKERREEKIATILQEVSDVYTDEEFKEQIKNFARSGMLLEDISKAVAQLKTKKKTTRHDNTNHKKEKRIQA